MSYAGRTASLLLVIVALTGCATHEPPVRSSAVLTRDGADGYRLAQDATSAVVTAKPRNTSNNFREVFWRDNTDRLDAQTCAAWTSDVPSNDTGQQGAALRITSHGGDTRAVTVTKHIFEPKPWEFNIHTWDSRSNPAYTQIKRFDLSATFHANGIVPPLPWHLCARVVGSTLSFIAWPDGEPTPAWGDPSHGGSVQIPAAWNVPGKAGWYAGHLMPGATMTFASLVTQPLP